MSKETEKGYTVLDRVDVNKQRDLPNSDPAYDEGDHDSDNFSYQEHPFDKHRHSR